MTKESDEIDLGQLFKLIGIVFYNISKFILDWVGILALL